MEKGLPPMDTVLDVWFHLGKEHDFMSAVEDVVPPLLELNPEELIEHWNGCAEGRLALILLYDQGPRNLFLNTPVGDPQAYAYASVAEDLATQFWEDGTYQALPLKQQMLAFFPYHHAESLEYQRRAKGVFDRLAEEDERFRWIAESSANYNGIIERFGRFPHRNLCLGRETTDDEWAFLVREWYSPEELRELQERGLLP